MTTRNAVGVLAGLVLLVGVVLGFVPTHSGGVSCGSAFVADYTKAAEADAVGSYKASYDAALGGAPAGVAVALGDASVSTEADCHSAVSTRRALTWPLVGVGLLGLAFVAMTFPAIRTAPPLAS